MIAPMRRAKAASRFPACNANLPEIRAEKMRLKCSRNKNPRMLATCTCERLVPHLGAPTIKKSGRFIGRDTSMTTGFLMLAGPGPCRTGAEIAARALALAFRRNSAQETRHRLRCHRDERRGRAEQVEKLTATPGNGQNTYRTEKACTPKPSPVWCRTFLAKQYRAGELRAGLSDSYQYQLRDNNCERIRRCLPTQPAVAGCWRDRIRLCTA